MVPYSNWNHSREGIQAFTHDTIFSNQEALFAPLENILVYTMGCMMIFPQCIKQYLPPVIMKRGEALVPVH